MRYKYGNRESYDIAAQRIKDGLWKVDFEMGLILSTSHWGDRPIGSPRDGYLRVRLGANGKHVSSHRVIWEAANGESDLDLTINHKDGDTLNNRLDNLEIISNAENCLHAHQELGLANGSRNKGTSNPQNVNSEDDVRLIKQRLAAGKRGVDIANEFGISQSTVSNIKHGVIWGWLD